MKPLRLELVNFGPYAHEVIDLTAVSLAVIAGLNGSGKSTLIDAIMVACFGQGSKGGSADDYWRDAPDVNEMKVIHDFRLDSDVYRIARHWSRSKTLVDLYQQVPDTGEWTNISAKGATETKKKIEKLLGVTYETMVASSVSLQGEAAVFSGMTDGGRLKLLKLILDTGRYDKLLEKAKGRRTRVELQAQNHRDEAGRARTKAEQAPAVKVAIEGIRQQQASQATMVSASEARQSELEGQLARQPGLVQQKADLLQRQEAIGLEVKRAGQELRAAETETANLQPALTRQKTLQDTLLAAEDNVAQTASAKEAAKIEALLLQEQVAAMTGVDKEVADLTVQMIAKKSEQETATNEGSNVRTELDKQQALIDQGEAIQDAAEAVQGLQIDLAEHDRKLPLDTQAQKLVAELESKVREWQAAHNSALAHKAELLGDKKRTSERLGQVPCSDNADMQAICPLLEDALEAAKQVADLEKEVAALVAEVCPHGGQLADAQAGRLAIVYDAQAHAKDRKELVDRKPLADKLGAFGVAQDLVRQLGVRRTAISETWQRLNREIKELQSRKDDLVKKQQSLAALRIELSTAQTKLQTAEAAHQVSVTALAKLQQAIEEAGVAEATARARIFALENQTETTRKRSTDLQAEANSIAERVAGLDAQLSLLATIATQLETAKAELTKARGEERRLAEELGALQRTMTEAEEAGKRAIELEAQAKEADNQVQVYQVLVDAYGGTRGKVSVPKLLVEAAVPQLEALANQFLSRIAGGRFAVQLETQVQAKSTGEDSEALAITVTDRGNKRKYALYSGAQKLVVDLALRFALSRFLAHRSGRTIDLFVIDEGLGALDKAYQQDVMEAILALGDEFGCVLIITHVKEVRDRLPQRIEVQETPEGSKVQVQAFETAKAA